VHDRTRGRIVPRTVKENRQVSQGKRKKKRGERKLSERTTHYTGDDDVDAVERLEWDSGMCVRLGSNVSTTG
jgi:hypothetical protein